MSTPWHDRWREGRIGFHRADVHPDLLRYGPAWLEGARRVLVPLCGKTVDLLWLRTQGVEVVGAELVPQAIEELDAEHGIGFEVHEDEPFLRYQAPGLTVYCGDFHLLTPERVGTFDRVWDRAALVALPPDVRRVHARTIAQLAPGGSLLLNALYYDAALMDGPPFAVSPEEVEQLYAGATREMLYRADRLQQMGEHLRQAGHSWFDAHLWRIELPGGHR